ncbi:CbiX/SirB N-terminal domain-containing protein, partial [Streptomyces sp. CBMA29]|uniref:CbiX/SirB N-terminal domain-containing protein n=1 Tax=Streptomyces sp. CBMA29 TaxID=1896314 RepID=UPI002948B834
PAYASAAAPTVAEAVAALSARGHRRIAVASYFTAPGRFAAQTSAAAPWIAAAPLGAHDAMAELVLHRYDEALLHDEARRRGRPPLAPAARPPVARPV